MVAPANSFTEVGISKASPHTILTILAQLGGFGIRGTFIQNGTPLRQIIQRYIAGAPTDCEVRGAFPSRWNPDTSEVDFTVGLRFPVNGKRGGNWSMVVSYEPNDTYAVWLVGLEEGVTKPLASRHGVYGDELREVTLTIYDEAIKTFNEGFIPLD